MKNPSTTTAISQENLNTTIALSHENKKRISALKGEYFTYDEYLGMLLGKIENANKGTGD